MNVRVIVHQEEDGGYWAEVPSLPGCYTQGDTMEELRENLRDVIQLFLSLDAEPVDADPNAQVLEIAV
jgi:predicted RNase H-like HicB family nuclease